MSIDVKYIYSGEACEWQLLVDIVGVSYFCLPNLHDRSVFYLLSTLCVVQVVPEPATFLQCGHLQLGQHGA